MGSNLKKGLFLVTITGAVTAFPHTVQASDQTAAEQILPQAGIEEVPMSRRFCISGANRQQKVSGWENCIPIMLRRSSDRWASGRRSSPGP